jgi:hypothetical protein
MTDLAIYGVFPSAQVGQFEAIEEERIFESSITACHASDSLLNCQTFGRKLLRRTNAE